MRFRSPGSPDRGPGTRPRARRDDGRLQQLELARDRLPVECPAVAAAASSPAASSAVASSSGQAASGNATAQITANWETFFNGQTPAAKKISLLENGQKFASVINAHANSGIATSAGAKVTKVVVNSPAKATVNYDLTLGGTTALANQTGIAVYQDGIWKVGDVSFCQPAQAREPPAPRPPCAAAEAGQIRWPARQRRFPVTVPRAVSCRGAARR